MATNHSTSSNSTTEDKALQLLGNGVAPEMVATTLGVSPSRISQLLSDEVFATKVQELRYENLQKHNTRDSNWDKLEDRLQQQLEHTIPLLMRPMEIVRAAALVNNMKRRGQSAPDSITNQQTIVNIVLPKVMVNTIQTNQLNQVVKAGEQELITIQSGAMEGLKSQLTIQNKINTLLEN